MVMTYDLDIIIVATAILGSFFIISLLYISPSNDISYKENKRLAKQLKFLLGLKNK